MYVFMLQGSQTISDIKDVPTSRDSFGSPPKMMYRSTIATYLTPKHNSSVCDTIRLTHVQDTPLQVHWDHIMITI